MLLRARPSLLFVQNPSVQLAYVACRLRPWLGYTLVVDRHSNFDFADTEHGLFNRLSNHTLRHADLTIVTNEGVARLVESKGGRAVILQDALPSLNGGRAPSRSDRVEVLYVCSFSSDEPVRELVEAARLLGEGFRVHITGRVRDAYREMVSRAPSNARFTGFLPEEEYVSLLGQADLVVVLTTRENTLLCGAYEGVSLRKPLVLSDQEALRRYFRKGVVLTQNTPDSIATAIRAAARDRERLGRELSQLAPELTADWTARFEALRSRLGMADAGA